MLTCPGCCCCFRWSVLRINEGNTQTLMSVLNLLKVVLDLLAQSGYKMSEYEGKLLLPGGCAAGCGMACTCCLKPLVDLDTGTPHVGACVSSLAMATYLTARSVHAPGQHVSVGSCCHIHRHTIAGSNLSTSSMSRTAHHRCRTLALTFLHPHLAGVVEKCGQSQDKLKADFKELMRKCCTLMPASKVLAYIKEGLDSKNNRTRVACAEEIAAMVDREGQKVGWGMDLGRCKSYLMPLSKVPAWAADNPARMCSMQCASAG